MVGKVYQTCEQCGEEFAGKSACDDFDCCKNCALAIDAEIGTMGYTNEWWDSEPRGEY